MIGGVRVTTEPRRGPLARVAADVGVGLLAGAIGTAAMTLASTIEMKATGRPASSTPAEAAKRTLGVEPQSDAAKTRFSNLVHWAYGTGWGGVRGLIGATGLSGPAAAALHTAVVWGTGLTMLPMLRVAPPVTQWSPQTIASDGLQHVVYGGATSAAYELLDRGRL